MLYQARLLASSKDHSNVEFKESAAESMPFLADDSVDAVVAGQAAHWFDQSAVFPELQRVLRQNGTLAFWGYKDCCFMNHSKATEIFHNYCKSKDQHLLGLYWSQPGRSIVENNLRDVRPPLTIWKDIQRIEYEPNTDMKRSGKGTLFISATMRLGDCMNYIRTFSAFHAWQEAHPDVRQRNEGGEGDVVDIMFDEMISAEPEWQKHVPWEEIEVDVEWGSGLILARKA